MHDLLVGALDRTAANAVAEAQVLVVPHPRGMVGVVLDEGVQGRPTGVGSRMQSLQPRDDLPHAASLEVVCEATGPAVGLARALPKLEAGVGPRVLEGMPEVEDLTDVREERGPVPDPLGPVSHDHHDGVRADPLELGQVRPEAGKELVGIPQTRHQDPAHHGVPLG
jgi:hypothetical protein